MNSNILIATILMATLSLSVLQNSYATGGNEVIGLVLPMIDDATKAVQNNNTQTALSLLEEIRNELSNTYFQEEED